ncbi:MAG: hypothetical protein PHT07_24730 [Paludibacter sp.]|nr:hypothetical protein [Paludibacter sp.]
MKKANNGEVIASLILKNPGLIPDVVEGISSLSATVRYKCLKIIRIVSEAKPGSVYPYYEYFEGLLNSENNIVKWNAIDIIANLVSVDSQDKFSHTFSKYYGLLNEGSLITSGHVVENSGKIAIANPNLRERISAEVLRVNAISLPTSECRSILAGKAITTLGKYPDLITDKSAVITFVQSYTNSTRNATKKKAQAFLEKLNRLK